MTEHLLAFDDEAVLATALAAALGVPCSIVQRHAFPDGETRLRLPPVLPANVAVLRGLQQPNAKLTELLLAAAGAREGGVQRLTLVSPYLAYMRQDMAFTPGEVVSQRHLGRLLAAAFDSIVTVDPHLHRVATLDEVVPGRQGLALSAAPLLGRFVAQQVPAAPRPGRLPIHASRCENRSGCRSPAARLRPRRAGPARPSRASRAHGRRGRSRSPR